MRHLSLLIPLALIAGATACTDTIAPPDVQLGQNGRQHLKWNAASGPVRFSAVAGSPSGEISLDRPSGLEAGSTAGDSLALEAYHVSFWAVRGERRYVQIDYFNASVSDSTRYPFLRLSIADPTHRPDGSPISVGDSVLVTVTVDPVELAVHLEPSGLQFGTDRPTVLKIWYTGANGDFNGDGVVNDEDSYIESELLGLWYQEGIGTPWEEITAAQSVQNRWFGARLEHFSGYAISW